MATAGRESGQGGTRPGNRLSFLKPIPLTIGTLAGAVTIFGALHFPALPGVLLLLAVNGIILLVNGLRAPHQLHGLAYAVIAVSAVAIAVPAVLLWPASGRAFGCSARTCYDFAGGTTQGWDVRIERGVRLGIRTLTTDSPHVGLPWQRGSLALDFRLGAPPADKAQIKIDKVALTKELSAWVYVPSDTPRTLELFAFVLEHNTGTEPGKPEWPFYKTGTVTLRPGAWTKATFTVADFAGVDTNQTWSNPPLLLGFEIDSREAGEFDGTVYFDHITVS